MKKKIATVISRVFDPFIVLSVMCVLTFIRGGVTHIVTWILAFALLVGVPVALIVLALRKKIVSNWDVSERRQRPNVLGVLVALEAVNVLILRPLVSPEVTRTLFFIVVVLLGFTGMTLYWKISGHTLAAALTTGMIIRWYGWGVWPVLLIVPLVAWSRVIRKDHTAWQVVAGAAYAWILVYFFT